MSTPGVDSDLDERLDSVLTAYCELHADLATANKELEAYQRDGLIFMSKARVSMGVHALTSTQYADDLHAATRVSQAGSRSLHWEWNVNAIARF
eukprot:m.260992 g.260992  ORF g.260992 m.260992 type:complete len:94 (+) comp19684_c0_seq3:142-423(+)